MIKKIISLFLCLLCTASFANTNSALKNAIDDFNYNITVAWDQKDKDVFESHVSKFQMSVLELQSKGVSPSEMKEEILNMVQDPKQREELVLKAEYSNLKTTRDLSDFVLANKEIFYSRGASWTGQTWLAVGGGVLLAAFTVIWIIAAAKASKWVCTQETQVCSDQRVCAPGQMNGNGTCNRYTMEYQCNQQCVDGYYKE